MARTQIKIEDRETAIKKIQSRIEELTFPELVKLTNEEKNKELLEIEKVLKEYLTKYQQKALMIDAQTKDLNLQDPDIENKNKNLYIAYKILLDANITELLQDGYILIETLRKTFTQSEIEYEIGIKYSEGGKGNFNVVNKKVSLAELLSYTKADIQWGGQGLAGFKLRATATQANFAQDLNRQKEIINNSLYNLHSLYPKVRRVLLENNYSNEGNFYETYQQLRYGGWADHSPNKKDPKGLKTQQIIDKYMEVRKGTQSFVSGGDWELIQFKLLSGSGASIASLLTIGEALKLILHYIEEGKKSNITIENIKKNVFSKEFDNKINNGLSDIIQQVEEEIARQIPIE